MNQSKMISDNIAMELNNKMHDELSSQIPSMNGRQQTIAKRSVDSSLMKSIPQIVWLLLIILITSVGLDRFETGIGGITGVSIGAIASWIIIGIWVLRGPDEAVEGLLLSLLLTISNPAIFPSRDFATLARWVILLLATIRVFIDYIRGPVTFPTWLKIYVLFAIVVGLMSFFTSSVLMVSLFKLLGFSLLIFTTYFGIRLGNRDWVATLIAFGAVIVIISLPLLLFPSGYFRNGFQFQGILSHPQSYGIVISISLALAIGRWMVDNDSPIKLYQAFIILVMIITLVMSGSRSGYLALSLAIILSIIFHKNGPRIINRLLFHPLTYFALAIILALILVQAFDPRTVMQDFIFERDVTAYDPYDLSIDPNSSVAAHFFASRATLVTRSMDNFIENPVLGIGFGVPSTAEAFAQATVLFGIPLSLPAEKGVMFSAMLEEVGIVGSILLFLMIFSQFRLVRQAEYFSILLLFFTALFINLGESVYFAAGGIGILIQIAIMVAIVTTERQLAKSDEVVTEIG